MEHVRTEGASGVVEGAEEVVAPAVPEDLAASEAVAADAAAASPTGTEATAAEAAASDLAAAESEAAEAAAAAEAPPRQPASSLIRGGPGVRCPSMGATHFQLRQGAYMRLRPQRGGLVRIVSGTVCFSASELGVPNDVLQVELGAGDTFSPRIACVFMWAVSPYAEVYWVNVLHDTRPLRLPLAGGPADSVESMESVVSRDHPAAALQLPASAKRRPAAASSRKRPAATLYDFWKAQ